MRSPTQTRNQTTKWQEIENIVNRTLGTWGPQCGPLRGSRSEVSCLVFHRVNNMSIDFNIRVRVQRIVFTKPEATSEPSQLFLFSPFQILET